jgi:hypothetical protein
VQPSFPSNSGGGVAENAEFVLPPS